MESNEEEAVLILNVSPDGKKTYTLQSDPTKRYTVNENGDLMELIENEVKLEMAEEPEMTDSLFCQLEDRSFIDDPPLIDFDMETIDEKRSSYEDDLELEEDEDILVTHMDIRDPLSTLKTNLEQRLGIDLHDYNFWLQESSQLECHKNLVDQCVSGEGLVQVNVQIRAEFKIINIVDVLKPADEFTDLETLPPIENDVSLTSDSKTQMIKRWTIDNQFKRDQQRLQIPTNPYEWSEIHVRHWLQWAVRQFSLSRIKLSDWIMSGEQLCNLTLAEFQEKVPQDPNDIFWTHLELLKKCKLVAVLQSKEEPAKFKSKLTTSTIETVSNNCGNRSGNNGQIQLWQFLLELLTDQRRREVIQWVGNEGEFKLISPEVVAQLWGERKNKPTMNYEKLSRALRYYYDGDMISKVAGKRFVYKFVCDLKQLIGYDAAQLALLVESCARRREFK